MRVISGTARGTKLKVVPGDTTRPIMDRVKENLFNIVSAEYIEDTRWLDLFGGTGQVGIEALSRGAAHCVFLDTAQAAIKTMQQNVAAVHMTDRSTILHSDAFDYLKSEQIAPFDVIYVAPPQYLGIWANAIKAIDLNPEPMLKSDGLAIAQIDPKEFEALELTNLNLYKQKKYGKTMLCFYEISGE